MNFDLLTKAYYLFDPVPSTISTFFWIFTAIFIVTIIWSFVLNKMIMQWPETTKGVAKKLFKNSPKTFLWLGVVGLLIQLFRYENVPYLSMRVITYGLVLLIVIFAAKMVYKRFKTYPQELKNLKTVQEKNKYLPKKK